MLDATHDRPTKEELARQAFRLAEENYETWGQYVVETMTDEEIEDSFIDIDGSLMSLSEWTSIRKTIAERYSEIENTAW